MIHLEDLRDLTFGEQIVQQRFKAAFRDTPREWWQFRWGRLLLSRNTKPRCRFVQLRYQGGVAWALVLGRACLTWTPFPL